LINHDSDKGDNTAATPGTSSSPKPSVSASSPPKTSSSPSAAAPSNAPTASATTAIGTTPSGWHPYTGPGGFTIAVPDGWNVQASGTSVRIQNFKGLFLLIQQSNTPKADAKADWETQARTRVADGDFPGYQEISIKTINYRNYRTAADWEFTFNKNGAQHVLNRGFVTSATQAYGFYWQTSASQWAAGQAFFQNFASSFQPAS
jgi:eukaryotic-like serine/threonine-protein kinase